jgi:hypothetical protein
MLGKRISCPKCREVFEAMDAEEPAAEPEPKVVSLKPSSPDPAASSVNATCPGCGRTIPLQPHKLSLTVECTRCNTRFTPEGPGVPPPVRRQLPPEAPAAVGSTGQRPGYGSPTHNNAAPTGFPQLASFWLPAIILAGIGLVLVLFFWIIFDPSVPIYPELGQQSSRVYNLGLMHDRQVGILVGLGLLVVGTILAVVTRKR